MNIYEYLYSYACVYVFVVAVQSPSCVQLFATLWTAAHQASLSFTLSRSLLKLMSLSQWCHPTISASASPIFSYPQSFPASGSFPMSWLFTSGGHSIGASASASVQFSHSVMSNRTSNEYSGLISFRIEWFDLLTVQGSLKSLLQHHEHIYKNKYICMCVCACVYVYMYACTRIKFVPKCWLEVYAVKYWWSSYFSPYFVFCIKIYFFLQ